MMFFCCVVCYELYVVLMTLEVNESIYVCMHIDLTLIYGWWIIDDLHNYLLKCLKSQFDCISLSLILLFCQMKAKTVFLPVVYHVCCAKVWRYLLYLLHSTNNHSSLWFLSDIWVDIQIIINYRKVNYLFLNLIIISPAVRKLYYYYWLAKGCNIASQ